MKTILEAIIEEAKLMAWDHPSKDARFFANSVYEYLTKRKWIGLTPEDLDAIYTGVRAVNHDVDFDVYGKAIESELKKRNGYELN